MTHRHVCWVCRDGWSHDDDFAGCIGVVMRVCPEDEGKSDTDLDPWYTTRRDAA